MIILLIYFFLKVHGSKFNRAKLLNVGFHEAYLQGFKCFIFHDVDLIPEDDRNIYTCSGQPRHMSVAVSTLNYKYVNDIIDEVLFIYNQQSNYSRNINFFCVYEKY